MNRKTNRREVFGHIAGLVIAVPAVTTAAYLWQIPQAWGRWAVLLTYSISILLMFAGAWIIFRRIVRRDYKQNGKLTPGPFFPQLLIWGLFFAFPCIYSPIDWAWSQSEISRNIPALGSIGWACVSIGLVAVAGSMTWLGVSASFGQKGKKLERSGPYRLTRNPQLTGGALLVSGYAMLWPSWLALGLLALFAAMAHWMVLGEEEHLRDLYGDEFEQYCRRVPRYLGSAGRSQRIAAHKSVRQKKDAPGPNVTKFVLPRLSLKEV